MKATSTTSWVEGFVIGLLLLAATPAFATIVATLENPGDFQAVSGTGLVSGWAYATNGQVVTVKPRLDGVTRGHAIPCCGPRQDVASTFADAPLETGFGGVIPYGALSEGAHTIGVEISAPGCETVIIDHVVTIAKPGNVEFLELLSTEYARVTNDGDEIIIVGAEIAQDPVVHTNLRATYNISSQSLMITEAYNESEQNTIAFNDVHAIFNQRCAVTGCHIGPQPPHALNLSIHYAYEDTLAIRSWDNPDYFRINPARPDESYLLKKVKGTDDIVGARMPLGCPNTVPCLNDTEIRIIEDWIAAGAMLPARAGHVDMSETSGSAMRTDHEEDDGGGHGHGAEE